VTKKAEERSFQRGQLTIVTSLCGDLKRRKKATKLENCWGEDLTRVQRAPQRLYFLPATMDKWTKKKKAAGR
jgi:hypothetical protein